MHKVGSVDDIAPGEALRIDTSPLIAVFHSEEGEFYAIDDTCTHQDASLADGWLEDCRVECPLHQSTFDVRTGHVDQPPAKRPVRVHRVVISNGEIFVEESSDAPNLPPGITVQTS